MARSIDRIIAEEEPIVMRIENHHRLGTLPNDEDFARLLELNREKQAWLAQEKSRILGSRNDIEK